MLLLDPATLSVHEIDNAALVMPPAPPPNMCFEYFETTARVHLGDASLATRFPAFRFPLQSHTLVFVELSGGRGWAWASRIRVAHHDEFPIRCGSIGSDFLFLWPVPMAINAYLSFREKARNVPNAGLPWGLEWFVRAVEGHPPLMSSESAMRALSAGSARELRASDLTVAQRLFVASLAPPMTIFAVRPTDDRWSEALDDADRRHLHNFLQADGGAPPSAPPAPVARARTRRRRRSTTRAAFDLSDDAVERVVCLHLAQAMGSLAEMGEAVARLRLVSQQFRRATDAALQQLVRAVALAARSLLGDRPREPVDVQAVVHAAGLTLRRALAFEDGDGWCAYARARRLVEKCDQVAIGAAPKRALVRSVREREQLLWRVGAA